MPHEVYNIGEGPLTAFVARSTADEWDKIVNYPSKHRPAELKNEAEALPEAAR